MPIAPSSSVSAKRKSLRRLLLRHAGDEQRHAELFRERARELPRAERAQLDFIAPGERGLDDLRVEDESTESLLAFLHLSERAAARRFAAYRDALAHDAATKALFERILEDEAFHMSYTRKQLYRLSPRKAGAALWMARAQRLWKLWLRIASAIANLLGTLILLAQYFVLLPPFALLLRRKPDPEGFLPARRPSPFTSQY